MPNWCHNSVTVSGPPEQVQALVDASFDFAAILPEPEEVCFDDDPVPDENDANNHNNLPATVTAAAAPVVMDPERARQDWRVEHWGTKWNVTKEEVYCSGIMADDDESSSNKNNHGTTLFATAGFGFDTAWSPPTGCYAALRLRGLRVRALYYEPGQDYMGVWDDGNETNYEPTRFRSTSKFWSTGLGAELEDAFQITEDLAEQEEEDGDEEAEGE